MTLTISKSGVLYRTVIVKDKTLGYLYFIDRTNPIANSQGKVYVHRHVWFKHSRINPKNLVIHHKDENKENNSIENLVALTRSEHGKVHQPVEQYIFDVCLQCHEEYCYPQRCLNKKNARKRKYCSHLCASNARRIVQRPDKEKLQIMVKEMGFVKTGQYFGVSDNAIRKWLKSNDGVPELPSKQ